jgi:ComF family protein
MTRAWVQSLTTRPWIRDLLAGALTLAAPPMCVACGRHAGSAEPLCQGCRRTLRWLGSERVGASGVETWAPLAYDGPARALVGALKFRGALPVAVTMAAQIVACAPRDIWSASTLVPVPLHPVRHRQRGFNQAERIAASVADRCGLELADCLRRRGPATTQVGRNRGERLRGIEGTVVARAGFDSPDRVVLVDDVITTGATLAACAAALRRRGARHVEAIAYARTLSR